MTIPGLKRSFQALKSIRLTLTLGYLVMVLFVLLLFGSGMYVFQARKIEHNVDTQVGSPVVIAPIKPKPPASEMAAAKSATPCRELIPLAN